MTGPRVDENEIKKTSQNIAQKEAPFIARNIESLSEKERPLEEPTSYRTIAEKHIHTKDSFMRSYDQGCYEMLLDNKDRAQIEEQLKPSRTTLCFFYAVGALVVAMGAWGMEQIMDSAHREAVLHEQAMVLSAEMKKPYLTQDEIQTIETKLNGIEKKSHEYFGQARKGVSTFGCAVLGFIGLGLMAMRDDLKRKNKRRAMAWAIYQQRNRCNEKA